MKKICYYSLNLHQSFFGYVKVRLQRLYCATLHASVEDDLMVNRKRFPRWVVSCCRATEVSCELTKSKILKICCGGCNETGHGGYTYKLTVAGKTPAICHYETTSIMLLSVLYRLSHDTVTVGNKK